MQKGVIFCIFIDDVIQFIGLCFIPLDAYDILEGRLRLNKDRGSCTEFYRFTTTIVRKNAAAKPCLFSFKKKLVQARLIIPRND